MNRTFTKSTTSDEGSASEGPPPEPLQLEFESNDSDSEEGGSAEDVEKKVPEKTAKQKAKSKTGAKHPPFAEMIASAISSTEDKKGATSQAIKTYMIANFFVSDAVIKRRLKSTLEKALADGMVIRPKPKKGTKEMTGLLGRFKLNPQWLKDQEKKKKAAEQKKAQAAKRKKPSAAKAKAPKIDGSNLTSLKDKSYSVRLAQDKVKQARKSLGMSPAVGKLAKKRPAAKKKKKTDDDEATEAPATKKARTTKSKSEETAPKKSVSKKKKAEPKAKDENEDEEKPAKKKKTVAKAATKKPAAKSKGAAAKKATAKSSKAKD